MLTPTHWQWGAWMSLCWGGFRSLARFHQGRVLILRSGICCEKWKERPHIFAIIKLPTRFFQSYQYHQSPTSSKRIYQCHEQYFKYFNNNCVREFIRTYSHIFETFLKTTNVLLLLIYNKRGGYFLMLCVCWKWNLLIKLYLTKGIFVHSLSDPVLFRCYPSQCSSSETGNLESWVAVVLEFLNLR